VRCSISILILMLDSYTCTMMLLFNRTIVCQKILVKSISRFLSLLKNSLISQCQFLFHLGAHREENSRPHRMLTWWRRRCKFVFTRCRPSTRQFIVNYACIRLIITVISRCTMNFVNREFSIEHGLNWSPLSMCAISGIWSQMINFVVTHIYKYVWQSKIENKNANHVS